MELGFRMHAERTPNPNSIKWVLGQPIAEPGRSKYFENAPDAEASPLAHALFAVDGVAAVFVAPGFVTVTKLPETDWSDIAQPIVDGIKAFVATGASALGEEVGVASGEASSETEQRIREIIDAEIRPAVAMDGGDITFASYRDGIVEVFLQGSCSGCPSSSATLKMGIEARLREEIPELIEVVAL